MTIRAKKSKEPVQAAGTGSSQDTKSIDDANFTPVDSTCQPYRISVDCLTRAAYLQGDLGMFLLSRLPRVEPGKPDPRFTPLFVKAQDHLDREKELLRRAVALELAGGEL